ncbi:MAG: hypothetical protein QNJ94_00540 [Alphaproteobacteria bacterium]|nr:hypothetical protein [Alphaproteobacteria bacterium]
MGLLLIAGAVALALHVDAGRTIPLAGQMQPGDPHDQLIEEFASEHDIDLGEVLQRAKK